MFVKLAKHSKDDDCPVHHVSLKKTRIPPFDLDTVVALETCALKTMIYFLVILKLSPEP